MCQSSKMTKFLHALPKCEHHIHIEGSLSPSLLFDLSRKNNIALPRDDPAFASIESLEQRYTQFTDLQDFLNYYYLAMSTLLKSSDFEDLMYRYLSKAVSDGLMHAEIFFDPQAHTDRGVTLETVVKGLRAGIDKAQREWEVTAELIMCFLRHLPESSAIETFSSAVSLEYLPPSLSSSSLTKSAILGVGLDSAELLFPPALFSTVFAEAGKLGLNLTAHAGEEGPAEYIQSALSELNVTRIDHGIKLITDEKLLHAVAQRKIMLSVCPLSNVRLRAVKSVEEVPIRVFLEAGVKFSINSDDPAYFGGYILDNYLAVQKAHFLSKQQWLTICQNAIEGSWCSQLRKNEMLAKLKDVSEKFRDV